MSQEEIEAEAQEEIKEALEKIKQKEEKNLGKKSSHNPSEMNDDEEPKDQLNEQLITKQNTIVNKNYERSDSISSSDSDSSPQDISDDEKNEYSKKNRKNKKINNELKKSTISNGSTVENLMVKVDLSIKILTLVSCIIIVFAIGLNIFFSLLNDKLTLTFGYSKNKDAEELGDIVMNHSMIYIYLFMMIGFNFGLFIAVLIGNDSMLTKLIYTDLNWYFVLTQFSLGFQFLITIIWEIDLWTINVCLSVSMLAILILAFYFIEIKQKKNMSKYTFFFIYIYISILFSFIAYLTLFNISCILMENVENDDGDSRSTLIRYLKVAINLCQTILSAVLLSYYQDIFFALSSAYIESAVFIHLDTKFEKENIALLTFVCIIVLGIILTLIRYKKKTFGYENVNMDITHEFN